jgi:hypothetical protein
VKTTQYVRIERAIAAADKAAIRERWLYGLRVLRDPDAFNKGSSQLKPHFGEAIVKASRAAGYRLSIRELGYRTQLARIYPTEWQINKVCEDFDQWNDLRKAGFPPYEAPAGEPSADHRTQAEKRRDRARALLDAIGEGATFFRLSDYEPSISLLKELEDYALQQDELTARFVEHGRKRREYLETLIEAADGDLSVTWQAAHERAYGEDVAV